MQGSARPQLDPLHRVGTHEAQAFYFPLGGGTRAVWSQYATHEGTGES